VADPTIAAVPGYAATIAAERWWLGRRRRRGPGPRGWPAGRPPVGYEERDTLTSLAMGGLSLLAPLVAPRLLRPLTPGVGRAGRALVGAAAGLAAVTTVADVVARRAERRCQASVDDHREAAVAERARRVASVGGVGAVATGGVALAAWWAHATEPRRLWDRRLVPDLGSGPLGWAVAMVGWDLIYYWNHRLMHEVRALWAIHVVHHSSQRYNLSTALRQPVADALGVFVPYGALCLVGVRPEVVAGARAWNLLYQYWIHTEVVGDLGQHAVAAPGAPRSQPPLPRPQPRRHPHRLGSPVRHPRARGPRRAGGVRPDHQRGHPQPRPGGDPRARRPARRRGPGEALAGPARARRAPTRLAAGRLRARRVCPGVVGVGWQRVRL
jgi:hypothetical protein